MNNFPKKQHNNTKTERSWYYEKTRAFKLFKAACERSAERASAYLHDSRWYGIVFPNRRSRAVLPYALFRKYKADKPVYGRKCGAGGNIGNICRTAFSCNTAVVVRFGGAAYDVCRGKKRVSCLFGHAVKRKIYRQSGNGGSFWQTYFGGCSFARSFVGSMWNRNAFGRSGQRRAYCSHKSYCCRDRFCHTLGGGSTEPYGSTVSFMGTP